MKKIIIFSLFCVIAAFYPLSAQAITADNMELYEEQLYESGANELIDALPEEVEGYIDEMEVSPGNGAQWSAGKLFDTICEIFKSVGEETISSFAFLFVLIIISALAERLSDGIGSASIRKMISVIISSSACVAAATPIAEYISEASSAVEICCNFDMVFIPVYTAIMAVCGKAATAAEYGALMISVLEGTAYITKATVLPLLRVVLAISLTSSVSPSLKLTGAVKLFEKYLKWILGFTAMLAVAVMGISTAAAGSMDEITAKTVRFVLSSSVPLVGGAMSDALASVTGCLSLLRTSVGGFGLIAMLFILLPPLIKGTACSVCLGLCSLLAEMFEVKSIKNIAETIESVISVMTAIILFTGVITIFTLAVMIGKGG